MTTNLIGMPGKEIDRGLARRRAYAWFQCLGWGALFLLPLISFLQRFAELKPDSYQKLHPAKYVLAVIMAGPVLGFLISHCSRPLLHRWGWKTLGWSALMPRMLIFSAVQAIPLTVLARSLPYWAMGPVKTPFKPDGAFFVGVLLNWFGIWSAFVAWSGMYFFYHLFERTTRAENDSLRLIARVKEAELQALRSQVNPHFLFNSLNSLRALIDEDPGRARLVVTQLASILRNALRSSQSETVPFAEELQVACDYLAIEQARFEERLRLRIEISPEAMPIAVPPMLLQTLVENAVKYGIAPLPAGGEVAIVARCHEGMLLIQVINPGMADPASAPLAQSTGVGLRNAAERLRLLWGDRASLQLRGDDQAKVVAEVVIPLSAGAPALP